MCKHFWRQNLNVEHSDSSFSMRSLLLLFFTHQFHNTKMKKTTTLSSLLLLLSSAKKLWYFMIRNHIPHITHYHTTTTQAHTKLPLTKKSKQTADISCCCILREGTAEVVSWHACLRHSWFEPLPPKVHTLPPSPSISLHLKWRPDDGLRNRQIDTKSSLFELFTSFSIIKLDFFYFYSPDSWDEEISTISLKLLWIIVVK